MIMIPPMTLHLINLGLGFRERPPAGTLVPFVNRQTAGFKIWWVIDPPDAIMVVPYTSHST